MTDLLPSIGVFFDYLDAQRHIFATEAQNAREKTGAEHEQAFEAGAIMGSPMEA